ncbi:MAG: hypothetical protein IM631_21975 [Cytophagales bacterium]|jgi:hypothetical protein|nr:hypothetical protein [Cytophagales bacterium]MCA6374031.1 hypothetical protein [Cytophagales bacterium]MCA6386099.1 hypothetical protein [Cytophagales bacterium]
MTTLTETFKRGLILGLVVGLFILNRILPGDKGISVSLVIGVVVIFGLFISRYGGERTNNL